MCASRLSLHPAIHPAPYQTALLPRDRAICKCLLQRLEDASEGVREAAASCLLALAGCLGDLDALALIPYMSPVLLDRLAAPGGLVESCEEARLALLRVLRTMLGRLDPSSVGAYAGEAAEVIRGSAAHDPHHECLLEVCGLAGDLVAALGHRLQPLSKQLVAAVAPLATHRRAAVRVAAVRALRVLMGVGAHEMILEISAWLDPNVVPIKAFYEGEVKANLLGKLATDDVAQVRAEFLDCVGYWLCNLIERKDHEPRLLPYLLSGLHDEDGAVQAAALDWLNKLGEVG